MSILLSEADKYNSLSTLSIRNEVYVQRLLYEYSFYAILQSQDKIKLCKFSLFFTQVSSLDKFEDNIWCVSLYMLFIILFHIKHLLRLL